jgi:hypothetical protein
MISQLRIRTEDSADEEFSVDTKIDALNNAQSSMLNTIAHQYLGELEVVELFSGSTNSPYAQDGVLDLNSLQYTVLGGARGVRTIRVNGGKFAVQLEQQDLNLTDNHYVKLDADAPYFVLMGDRVEFFPKKDIELDVWYIREPLQMSYTSTDNTYVESQLNANLHGLLLDYAEANCWAISEEFTRRTTVLENARHTLEMMNSKYQS